MITVVAGTNRQGSNTLKVAKIVAAMHRELGADVSLLDLADLPSSVLSPRAYADKPDDYAEHFQQPILDADGVVIVTPEYNGSFPGVLKLFVDMLPFPESFESRPTAYVGLSAGIGGALRSVEQLQMIFGYRNAFNFSQRVFMPGIRDLLDEEGNLTDKELFKRLERQAGGFQEFVAALMRLRGRKSNG